MTGIREAYQEFKARVKESRGRMIVCRNNMASVVAMRNLYPSASIFIMGEDDEPILVVDAGRWVERVIRP